MMWTLVLWFGFSTSQAAITVPGIATEQDCKWLGQQMKEVYRGQINCFRYRAANPTGAATR